MDSSITYFNLQTPLIVYPSSELSDPVFKATDKVLGGETSPDAAMSFSRSALPVEILRKREGPSSHFPLSPARVKNSFQKKTTKRKDISLKKKLRFNVFFHSLHRPVHTLMQRRQCHSKLRSLIDFRSLFEKARKVGERSEIALYTLEEAPSFLRQAEFSDEQISYLTTKLYLKFCRKRWKSSSPKQGDIYMIQAKAHSLAMQTVSLPAFFNRKIVLCPPVASDYQDIVNHLYVHDFAFDHREKLTQLIEQRGFLQTQKSAHQLIVLGRDGSEKTLGAIHFKIKHLTKKTLSCYIYSLKVHAQARQKGYGSLLLSYAIKVAEENKCHSICLKSSEQALRFYFNFGFMADEDCIESYEEWENLDPASQEELALNVNGNLVLELNEPRVEEKVAQCLEVAISDE